MKTVVDAQTVCHLFNAQFNGDRQQYATTPTRNLSFNGRKLTSYDHYTIGHFIDVGNNDNVLLMVESEYSLTTARQCRFMREATSNRKSFTVDNPDASTPREHIKNVEHMVKHLASAAKSALKATTRFEDYRNQVDRWVNVICDYCTTFKIRSKVSNSIKRMLKSPGLLTLWIDELKSEIGCDGETWLAKINAKRERAKMREFKQHQKQEYFLRSTAYQVNLVKAQKQRAALDAAGIERWEDMTEIERLQHWRNGLERPVRFSYTWNAGYAVDTLGNRIPRSQADYDCPKFDRIRFTPGLTDKLKTSKNVEIKVSEFKRLMMVANEIRANRMNPVEQTRLIERLKGLRIAGHFALDYFDIVTGVVTVGCHQFEWFELATMVNQCGLNLSTDWTNETRLFLEFKPCDV